MYKNKYLITGLTLLSLGLASANVLASAITNGDFSTCDFSTWQKDTDGYGDMSLGGDFVIRNNGGSCSAGIKVDHFDPAGDSTGSPIDSAYIANTLFHGLDFSAAATSTFRLDIDFSVSSELDSSAPNFTADYFLIGLNDGSGNYFNELGDLGFLFAPTAIDGAMSHVLSFELDNSFVAKDGWFLDFQLNIGADKFGNSDAFGSTFWLNNVSLTEVAKQVPEPDALWLLSLGLIGSLARRKRS